jgi:hypothetical protein
MPAYTPFRLNHRITIKKPMPAPNDEPVYHDALKENSMNREDLSIFALEASRDFGERVAVCLGLSRATPGNNERVGPVQHVVPPLGGISAGHASGLSRYYEHFQRSHSCRIATP